MKQNKTKNMTFNTESVSSTVLWSRGKSSRYDSGWPWSLPLSLKSYWDFGQITYNFWALGKLLIIAQLSNDDHNKMLAFCLIQHIGSKPGHFSLSLLIFWDRYFSNTPVNKSFCGAWWDIQQCPGFHPLDVSKHPMNLEKFKIQWRWLQTLPNVPKWMEINCSSLKTTDLISPRKEKPHIWLNKLS